MDRTWWNTEVFTFWNSGGTGDWLGWKLRMDGWAGLPNCAGPGGWLVWKLEDGWDGFMVGKLRMDGWVG